MANAANNLPVANAETPRQKLAPEARHKDIQASHETARAAVQASILINGGAATAILAYLSKSSPTPASITQVAAWALALYAAGVVLGALSAWFSGQASASYGYAWEAVLDGKPGDEKKHRDTAGKWVLGHRVTLPFSILLFALGCGAMTCGFLRV